MTILTHHSICRADNYCVLVHDSATGRTASIDAPDESGVLSALQATGWTLTDILVTHKHPDHIEGIGPLKERFHCSVYAPMRAKAAVPDADQYVDEGAQLTIGSMHFDVIATPGHCDDHISYVLPAANMAFTADALFAMGCGRVVEGKPEVLYHSLMRLAALPDETIIHCGHEYTLSNARFALSVEPNNPDIVARAAAVEALRKDGKMTLPTTIGLEKRTNVFLRAGSASRFAELREAKNRF
jgi:hydroxyacylglutathione hydrolase